MLESFTLIYPRIPHRSRPPLCLITPSCGNHLPAAGCEPAGACSVAPSVFRPRSDERGTRSFPAGVADLVRAAAVRRPEVTEYGDAAGERGDPLPPHPLAVETADEKGPPLALSRPTFHEKVCSR